MRHNREKYLKGLILFLKSDFNLIWSSTLWDLSCILYIYVHIHWQNFANFVYFFMLKTLVIVAVWHLIQARFTYLHKTSPCWWWTPAKSHVFICIFFNLFFLGGGGYLVNLCIVFNIIVSVVIYHKYDCDILIMLK